MPEEETLDYESLHREALRGVVRKVMMRIAKTGLPADHHFYISFATKAEGVGLSKRLREQYPDEMTIVLQHRFWDLYVHEDRFEVKLTFNSIPERLVIPYESLKVFFDPSVPFGLQFEHGDQTSRARASDIDIDDAGVIGRGDSSEADGDAKAGDQSKPVPMSRPALAESKRKRRDPAAEPAAKLVPAEASGLSEEAVPIDADEPKKTADVVSLDAFRKK